MAVYLATSGGVKNTVKKRNAWPTKSAHKFRRGLSKSKARKCHIT